MKKKEVLFANIQPDSQNQGLEWLMLTPPKSELDQACLIYLFYKITEPHFFDEWFENLETAFRWAEEVYNVKQDDWKTIDDISRIGIKLNPKEVSFIQAINNKR